MRTDFNVLLVALYATSALAALPLVNKGKGHWQRDSGIMWRLHDTLHKGESGDVHVQKGENVHLACRNLGEKECEYASIPRGRVGQCEWDYVNHRCGAAECSVYSTNNVLCRAVIFVHQMFHHECSTI